MLSLRLDKAEALLGRGARVDARYEDGATLLLVASGSPATDAVRFLLQHGANPNHPHPDDGITPLILAAKNGPPETVRVLLAYGADPSLRSDEGSALELARKRGDPAVLEVFGVSASR